MSFPMFADGAGDVFAKSGWVSKREVSNVLGVDDTGARKLVQSGMLPDPTPVISLAPLRGRGVLAVSAGALTVLRTDARTLSAGRYPADPRKWLGFHVDHSDGELAESSLRWWRSDPVTVLDNELFVVTVAEFPVALYLIDELAESVILEEETRPRHGYSGRLLARVLPGLSVRYAAGLPDRLDAAARRVMGSRIKVISGGPIGYLRPSPAPRETGISG